MIGETLTRHLELIAELDAADRAALAALPGEIREVPRGEDILTVGEKPTVSVVLLSGMLQRYATTPEGQRQIHSFYVPTDAPCLEALHIDLMDNCLCPTVASRVGIIPHAALYRLIDQRPRVRTAIWRETLVQGAIYRESLLRNCQKQADARMAHLFCEVLTRARAAGVAAGLRCDLPVTQEDLADALGMSTVHVNRTLMALRAEGLLEFRGGVLTVADWGRVAALADFDPGYLHLRRAARERATAVFDTDLERV
jgi:CRP-like cAMP-binding protein